MRLHLLPEDAIENVCTRLSTSDILATARASAHLTTALVPYLRRAHVTLDRTTKPHLLACGPRVASHIRHLTISGKLSSQELLTLAYLCTSLQQVSFNLSQSLPAPLLQDFLSRIAPSLRRCAVEFCAAFTGDVLLNALAEKCRNLHSLVLRFVSHVHAHDVRPFVVNVGHSLRVLELEDCGGVDDHVLISIARYCHNLQRLCVGGSEQVGDEGVIAIAESPCAKTLTTFDIRSCMCVTDVGVFALATSAFALTSLNLWRVCVTTYGVRAVAEGLGVHLETLVIGDCIGVDDRALESIAENCDSLVTLEMCGLKRITDRGIMALFDSQRTGRLKLHYLTIDRCTNITSKGVLAAAGLFDERWTTSCSCTLSCCNNVPNNHTHLPKECSLGDCTKTKIRKQLMNLVNGQGQGVEREDNPKSIIVKGSVERQLMKGSSGSQLCTCDFFESRDEDEFRNKFYVSYLQKLSANDTRVAPRVWQLVRERRPDLQLVADDCGMVDDALIERTCDGESWNSEYVRRCMNERLVSGLKRRTVANCPTGQMRLLQDRFP